MESRKVSESKIKAKRAAKMKQKTMNPLDKLKKMVSEIKMAQTDFLILQQGGLNRSSALNDSLTQSKDEDDANEFDAI